MGLQKYQAASQVDLVTSQNTIFAFILNVRLLKQHKTKHLVVNLSNFTQMNSLMISVQLVHLVADARVNVITIPTVLVIWSASKEMVTLLLQDVFHSDQVTMQNMITVMTLHALLIMLKLADLYHL